MSKGPKRLLFLLLAAGAVAMGTVGALSSKLQFASASEAGKAEEGARKPSRVEIPVFMVAGGKKEAQILVPDAEASPEDTVVWVPKDGVKRILWVKFDSLPNPFSKTQRQFDNLPDPAVRALSRKVLSDIDRGTYKYTIKVLPEVPGPPDELDPPLDIVPGG